MSVYTMIHDTHEWFTQHILQCVAECCSVLQCVAVRCLVFNFIFKHDKTRNFNPVWESIHLLWLSIPCEPANISVNMQHSQKRPYMLCPCMHGRALYILCEPARYAAFPKGALFIRKRAVCICIFCADLSESLSTCSSSQKHLQTTEKERECFQYEILQAWMWGGLSK